MSCKNDSSPHCDDWTNAKLIRELKRIANMEGFGGHLPEGYVSPAWHTGFDDGGAIREATRLYRDSWLNPLIEEIEKRFVKVTK